MNFNIWWIKCWPAGFYVHDSVSIVKGHEMQQLASIFWPKNASMINIPGRLWQSASSTQPDLMIESRSWASQLWAEEMYNRCGVGTNGKTRPLQHRNGNYPDNNPVKSLWRTQLRLLGLSVLAGRGQYSISFLKIQRKAIVKFHLFTCKHPQFLLVGRPVSYLLGDQC